MTADSPPWMRYPGRWGDSRAGWVPGEMDSPRGPAFQPQGRWADPSAWAAAARSCTRRDCDERGECDGRETAIAGGLACVGVLWALWLAVAADAAGRTSTPALRGGSKCRGGADGDVGAHAAVDGTVVGGRSTSTYRRQRPA